MTKKGNQKQYEVTLEVTTYEKYTVTANDVEDAYDKAFAAASKEGHTDMTPVDCEEVESNG